MKTGSSPNFTQEKHNSYHSYKGQRIQENCISSGASRPFRNLNILYQYTQVCIYSNCKTL